MYDEFPIGSSESQSRFIEGILDYLLIRLRDRQLCCHIRLVPLKVVILHEL
jgi:hypothetical protein